MQRQQKLTDSPTPGLPSGVDLVDGWERGGWGRALTGRQGFASRHTSDATRHALRNDTLATITTHTTTTDTRTCLCVHCVYWDHFIITGCLFFGGVLAGRPACSGRRRWLGGVGGVLGCAHCTASCRQFMVRFWSGNADSDGRSATNWRFSFKTLQRKVLTNHT